MRRQAVLQRGAGTGDRVQRGAVGPQPPSQDRRLQAGGAPCGLECGARPERPLPGRRQDLGRVVDLVDERLDHQCGVVDLGHQQFSGPLAQPDQRMVGQCHVGHHRQGAADQDCDQPVGVARPGCGRAHSDGEHHDRAHGRADREIAELRDTVGQSDEQQCAHRRADRSGLPDEREDRGHDDADAEAGDAPGAPGVGVCRFRPKHHHDGQRHPVAVLEPAVAGGGHRERCRHRQPDGVAQDG